MARFRPLAVAGVLVAWRYLVLTRRLVEAEGASGPSSRKQAESELKIRRVLRT